MMTAMTATDLRHRHLVCLLDESRHLMCVDLDLLRSPSATGNQRWWAALDRTGPIDVSPQAGFCSPTILPEAVFMVDRTDGNVAFALRSLRRSANLPLCLSESWKVDLAGQIQNCEFPTRGLGFQLVPLFDVPQDEIMDVPPSSAQLKYPKRGGIAGMFQVDADGDKVAFRSPFMRSGCHLQAWENNPLRCANTHFGEWEKWVLKPSVPKWKSQTRLQLVNCQWPERALQHTVRPVCFVSKDAFLASQTQEGLKQDAHILDTKEALDDALDALASIQQSTYAGDRQKLPVSMVIQRGIDMCQGLQDLHAAGIVMGSLSQANVS
ncbi:hypothetical protein WJX82_001403 [Trebouxia sp. C0006]